MKNRDEKRVEEAIDTWSGSRAMKLAIFEAFKTFDALLTECELQAQKGGETDDVTETVEECPGCRAHVPLYSLIPITIDGRCGPAVIFQRCGVCATFLAASMREQQRRR